MWKMGFCLVGGRLIPQIGFNVLLGGGWVLSKCVGTECPLPPIAHSFFLSYYIFFFLSMVYG